MSDPLVGRLLDGRYAVQSRIARGGMSTVYLALDERLDREVAVKVMHASLSADDDFVRRFIREARAAARLSHPGIVQVFDQCSDHGVVFLAMEYVDGRTLRDLMRERGALTPREALDVLEPVLEALSAAHRAGLVHRDVKPENVLLAEDGRVKVADFGLARLITTSTVANATGVVLGTVAYLAPEQVERGISDARTDVYASGVLLFEMLTASKPFEGETALQVAYQHVHGEVPAPSTRASGIPAELDDVVLEASANDPDERPRDARELLERVRAARSALAPDELDERPVPLERPTPPRRARGDDATAALAATPVRRQGATAELRRRGRSEQRSDEPAPRRRRGRLALVAVLMLAVLLGMGGWYVGAGPGAYTDVPLVAGRPVDQARSTLSAAGLAVRTQQAFSETAPTGQVLSSTPRSRARKGSAVTLVVSRGPERYTVPKLAGMAQETAAAALTNNKLTVSGVQQAYDETVPAGRVLSSDPPAGERLEPFQGVALVVSQGRKPIPVQSLVAKNGDEAVAALQAAGFTVTATRRYDDNVPQGDVISQTPDSGTGYRGTAVALVLSRGPRLVAVPDVIRKQVADAKALLEAQGFRVQVTTVLGGFFGTVRSQDPAAGSQAPTGSTITLTVV